ncbi:hypothetical protein KCP75_21450 [Salmonella enterica subsp. enterica]|nr:hypothetical protein KCP75_21450 [Salmonella enterica subsp. enterica]
MPSRGNTWISTAAAVSSSLLYHASTTSSGWSYSHFLRVRDKRGKAQVIAQRVISASFADVRRRL